jgi:hypothetical protein
LSVSASVCARVWAGARAVGPVAARVPWSQKRRDPLLVVPRAVREGHVGRVAGLSSCVGVSVRFAHTFGRTNAAHGWSGGGGRGSGGDGGGGGDGSRTNRAKRSRIDLNDSSVTPSTRAPAAPLLRKGDRRVGVASHEEAREGRYGRHRRVQDTPQDRAPTTNYRPPPAYRLNRNSPPTAPRREEAFKNDAWGLRRGDSRGADAMAHHAATKTAFVEVVGTAHDTCPAVYLFTTDARYLFNCGEGACVLFCCGCFISRVAHGVKLLHSSAASD